MVERYPFEQVPSGGIMPDRVATELAGRNQITAWTGVGALYGTRAIVKAARAAIRKILKPFSKRIVFLTLSNVRTARQAVDWVPFLRTSRVAGMLERAEAFLLNAGGRPSNIALPLAYWKCVKRPPDGLPLNPARDGCGLLWYSPLIPMKAGRVREYVSMVEAICREYGIEPLITLTSLSNRCFDSTVPILFDRENPEEAARAHACLEALFAAGRTRGFFPYRASVHAMQQVVDPAATFWQMARSIKQAVDPQNLIAPGRYGID
jgi:4-cresol dehydrogenase (hydroxylating)